MRPEQADRNALSSIPFLKAVGHADADHAVDPALEDRRRLAPPVGVDDDDAFCPGDLVSVLLDLWGQRCIIRDLLPRQQGIEPLGIEVVVADLVPVVLQGLHDRLGDGVVETVLVGVC